MKPTNVARPSGLQGTRYGRQLGLFVHVGHLQCAGQATPTCSTTLVA